MNVHRRGRVISLRATPTLSTSQKHYMHIIAMLGILKVMEVFQTRSGTYIFSMGIVNLLSFYKTIECSKKVKDHLEKALAAFNKDIRHNQHKVHLLCLVARGLYLSRQCDNIIRQGLLLSVLGEKLTVW